MLFYITAENRILDALSVFLSVPLPKKAKEFDDNPHVSILKIILILYGEIIHFFNTKIIAFFFFLSHYK